jgi:predicted  nucleic acid-binding Zn-ribbon protein
MIGYQDKINQILRGAETIKNMNDDIDLELSVSVLTKTLKDVQLERDALWVKTQEDEREINDLRDINKQLRGEVEKLEDFIKNHLSDLFSEVREKVTDHTKRVDKEIDKIKEQLEDSNEADWWKKEDEA